jgi:hypothetical protein
MAVSHMVSKAWRGAGARESQIRGGGEKAACNVRFSQAVLCLASGEEVAGFVLFALAFISNDSCSQADN